MADRKNVFVYSADDRNLLDQRSVLIETVNRYGFTSVDHHEDASIIISLGTDGTFLQAVRKTGFRQDCLYAGVSTTGQLAMYCDFHFQDLQRMIEAVRSEAIEVRRYPTIRVTVDDHPSFYCLNEFSIRSNIVKTIVFDVSIDGKPFETFRGDGVIIATPTGSTAYNKSVNGAVVDPLLPCFQVSELASMNNNLYRTLGSSFILSGSRTLQLRLGETGNDYPTMGMDNEALSIRHVDQVSVELSERVVKTVKLKDNTFWDKVKRTFL